ncbi:MAG TPA: VTT domain-containing protein [Thermoleophilaceae bacterium]|jgi:uncharacterized membrane protein YdjX (TVP38/TMEM64 family)
MAGRMERLRARRAALVRLAVFGTVLAILFVASRIAGVDLSPDSIEDYGDDIGPLGIVAFVPAAIVLNSLFVLPVPVFAGGAGLLFGVPLGTALSVVAVFGSCGFQNAIGRRFGGARAERLLGRWGRTLDDLLDRRGFTAVLYVRLTPLSPYTALNYATGATRLGALALASGSTIAMAPRVYAYVALGGSLHDLFGSTQGIVALALFAGTWALGLVLIVRAFVRHRGVLGPRAAEGDAPSEGAT